MVSVRKIMQQNKQKRQKKSSQKEINRSRPWFQYATEANYDTTFHYRHRERASRWNFEDTCVQGCPRGVNGWIESGRQNGLKK